MKKMLAIFAVLTLSLAVASPAKAQFWGGGAPWGYLGPGYYGGYGGGWGYGGYGYGMGMMGAMGGGALLGGVIGGAIASQSYAPAPVYVYPQNPRPTRRQVIIKNSPGARVYEEEYQGW